MPRTMYDSVTPTDIPTSAQMVAGYVDGAYAWPDSGWLRFPNARKVTITVTGASLDANVADVEAGDLSPAQGVAWARAKRARGEVGVLYFSLGLWPQIRAQLTPAEIAAPFFETWVALWDGKAQLQPGWLAKQYANPTLSGGHFDLSIVGDYWPGVDPAPSSAPPQPSGVPVTIPPPPPGSTPPLDQVRAAWARLGDLFVQVIPNAIIALDQAVSDLKKLP